MRAQDFDEADWKFEDSSGYAGARNIHTDEWIYADEYWKRKNKKESYHNWKLIAKEYEQSDTNSNFLHYLIENYHSPTKL